MSDSVDFYNSSGESIPAYAVMEIEDAQTVSGRTLLKVRKPTGDSNEAGYLFNGPASIPAGKVGTGYTASEPSWAKYDTGGSPVNGDEWGPASGSWELNSGQTGFKIIGGAASGRVLVRSFCSGSTDPASNCGACNEPSGTADVDLSSFATGLVASTYYRWDMFCTGVLIVLFTHTGGGVWTGSADGGLTLNCDDEEDPVTFSVTLAVSGSGHLPGEVTITVTVGSDSWAWTNRESWQPNQKWEFTLVSGPADCPCAPFRKKSCLVPDDGVA